MADICPPKLELELEQELIINNNTTDDEKEKNSKIFKCYEENIGSLTPASAELILSFLDDFSEEMIIEAIKTASIQNVRKAKYIAGILNDWKNKGYKVLTDIDSKNKTESEEKDRDKKIMDILRRVKEENERK